MDPYMQTHTFELKDMSEVGERVLRAVGDVDPPLLRAALLLILTVADWPDANTRPTAEQIRMVVEPTAIFMTERVHEAFEGDADVRHPYRRES